jgi:hypothetical protein
MYLAANRRALRPSVLMSDNQLELKSRLLANLDPQVQRGQNLRGQTLLLAVTATFSRTVATLESQKPIALRE